jgi:2-methylcitrate dehydratase PrpD
MCKPLHPGRAAQNGLTAALLAARDFTSSDQALEARRGFAQVTATERDLEVITRSLGDTWEVVRNTYKPFACGVVIHPAIEACIRLRAEHAIEPEQVEWVHLQVHPLVLELTGKKAPRTGLEGKFSVYHSCAVALLHGAAGEAQYSDSCVRDARIVALRGRVQTEVDRSIDEDQVRAAIGLRDGRVLEHFVEHAIGSIARPMSDADLEAKFRGLVAAHLASRQIDQLLRLLRDVESLPDAGAIARACVPGAALS